MIIIGFEYKDFKAKPKAEKKGMKDKLMERLGPKAMQKQQEDETNATFEERLKTNAKKVAGL